MTNIDADRLGELLLAERKLNALEAGGVNNWEGYDYAMELYDKECDCSSCEECYNESEEEATTRHKEEQKDENDG